MTQNTSHAVMSQRHASWRQVPSFPRYWANAAGEVKGPRGFVLKGSPNKGGYLQLNVCRDGKIYSRRTHTLVCEAFHGLRPTPQHEVAHGNGIRSDNCESNLRWATPLENRDDMRSHGTWPAFEAHPRAGITRNQAAEIRRLHAESVGAKYATRGVRLELASMFGACLSGFHP
jgi:hypothetical protein